MKLWKAHGRPKAKLKVDDKKHTKCSIEAEAICMEFKAIKQKGLQKSCENAKLLYQTRVEQRWWSIQNYRASSLVFKE
jgi:hypothetical protein